MFVTVLIKSFFKLETKGIEVAEGLNRNASSKRLGVSTVLVQIVVNRKLLRTGRSSDDLVTD